MGEDEQKNLKEGFDKETFGEISNRATVEKPEERLGIRQNGMPVHMCPVMGKTIIMKTEVLQNRRRKARRWKSVRWYLAFFRFVVAAAMEFLE